MASIVNIYRIDPTNIGDCRCSPVLYVDALRNSSTACITELLSPIPDILIVGGGGVLYFEDRFAELAAADCLKIGWGIGANRHGSSSIEYPDVLRRFDLLGVRDWGSAYRWVPCVSCLSPLFDASTPPIHDVVAFEHKDFPLGLPFATMANDHLSFEDVISFLASGDTVVTSSYHGAYWATLLGRRVVAVPFSSKFYGFRHRPVLTTPDGWKDGLRKARCYPESLEEAREANMRFAEDAICLISEAIGK